MVVEELAVDGTVTSSRKLTASIESKERRSSSSLYKRSLPSPSSVAFKLCPESVSVSQSGLVYDLKRQSSHLILTKSFIR